MSTGKVATTSSDKTKPADLKTGQQASNHTDPMGGSKLDNSQLSIGKNASVVSLTKQQLTTIDTYDPLKYQLINSPRSLQSMKELGITQEDLHLKTEDDLRGMFNLEDAEEVRAFKVCVEKHKLAFNNIKEKVSNRRKEIISRDDETEKKRKEAEVLKNKQLKKLEEEKKTIMKQLEAEQKKKDEAEKRRKLELEKAKKDADKAKSPSKSPDKSQQGAKSAQPGARNGNQKSIDLGKPGTQLGLKSDASPKTSQSALPTQPTNLNINEQSLKGKSDAFAKTGRGGKPEEKKPLKLEEELKESSILVFLDKSTAHKELLDIQHRTKRDLERDKQRMKELMQKQKQEIMEMSQKRNPSAYKSHENLGNAKTRKIEYLYDLSRNPVELLKDKQQKEMESMMNYEIALQAMKKQREEFLKNKHEFLRGEQQHKEIVLEYNKKILERERQLKEMQRKIDQQNKLYHVERTKKANEFERKKMVKKLTSMDDRAKHMKEDRQDYLASRKFMVQKLRKDLESMKGGAVTVEEVEKKYKFLHNDKEFQDQMREIKKELNPGSKIFT